MPRAAFIRVACVMLAILGFVCGARAEGVSDLVIGADFTSATLAGHMAMLRDPEHRFDLEDVAFGPQKSALRPAPKTIALGYTRDAVWFKITIRQEEPGSSDLFLRFQPNFLDSIRVFVPRTADPASAADFRVTELGDHANDPQRIFFPPFQAMRLAPPDAELFDVYVRVETSSSLTLRARLSTRSYMSEAATRASFSYGVVVALMLGLAALHFLQWLQLRQGVFFWYSCLLLSAGIVVYSIGGFDNVGDNQFNGIFISDYVAYIALLTIYFFGIGFLASQTEAKVRAPRLYRIAWIVMGFIVASIIATLFGFYRWVIVPNLVIIMVFLVVFSYANVRLALKDKVGKVASAAACVTHTAIAVPYDAGLLGILAIPPLVMSSIVTACVLFIVMMTVSLMQRAAAFERLRKESEALRVARRAERAATELVEIRTAELVAAKEDAERALEQERAAQLEQLRFVDVVTHQYQTPLAIIRSSVTAIRYALAPDDTENRQRTRQIEAAVRRLVEIMDVSLHRSRMEGHAAKAVRRRVPVIATVTGALARSRDMLPGRTLQSVFRRIGAEESASLDPDLLGIALANLVDNAAKFSDADCPIFVRISRNGTDLVIEVEDEGIGIPAHELDRISQRYFRASNAGHVVGTGLGLNIVRQIATAHDGTFKITPRPDKGVIARLVIPAFIGA